MQIKHLTILLLFITTVHTIQAQAVNLIPSLNSILDFSPNLNTLSENQIIKPTDTLATRITFHPFYFTKNALRLSYDRKLKDRNWLEISPIFFLAEKSGEYDDFTSLSGVGTMVYYKYYVNSLKKNSGPYIGAGAMFNYFWIEYPLYEYSYDNSTGSTIDQEYRKTDFAKFGGDIIIGYDFMFADGKFTGGVYTGLGYRYAKTKNSIILNRFTNFFGDYAYSGNIMLLGFRLGAAF